MTALSADRPSSDPTDDLFGHAPFARSLAESICGYPGSDGLVMALYGPWGSGKSTVLGYVQHFLEQRAVADQPVLVKFNPWWFSGQENLARAFLGQLQAVLPAKSERFKKLGDLLGDFAEGIGGLIDLSGMTGGAAGKLGKLLGMMTKRKPRDVPALKAQISKILLDAKKRVVVMVDDIDRLTPDETRQLFTVIKALADFPNVLYLLAFDRDVAAQAIGQQGGLPGARYLEKIIQVPFELPPVDRIALRAMLFRRLDEILGSVSDGVFDHEYWTNVYHDGIDALIQVPRDVVRFVNTLAVTYPSVRGEVTAVDFIALESVRVFLPDLYDTLRANPERFAGHSNGRHEADRRESEAFHRAWVERLPAEHRASSRALIERVFPKTSSMGYGAAWLAEWRRGLRACHPDLLPIYFRLSLPSGAVSRREMFELLASIATPDNFKARLVSAKDERRPDGLSKARALLERLMDHVEADIPSELVGTAIGALLDVGDALIDPADERGMFDFGNISRVSRPVYHLLKRVPDNQRVAVLESAIRSGQAVAVQRRVLSALAEEAAKSETAGGQALIASNEVDHLKPVWIERVRSVSSEPLFTQHPELPRLLAAWRQWAGDAEVRAWCDRAVTSDEGLLRLIAAFLQHTKSQSFGDVAVRVQPRLNPSWIEPYIDVHASFERLSRMAAGNTVPAWAKEAVEQFTKEQRMLAAGKNPDGIGAFDDEEGR